VKNEAPIVLLYSVSSKEKNIYYGVAKDKKQTEKLYHAMNKAELKPLYYKKFVNQETVDSWIDSESDRLEQNKFKPFFTKQVMHPYFIRSTSTDDKRLVTICNRCETDLNHLPPTLTEVCPSTVLDSVCYFYR